MPLIATLRSAAFAALALWAATPLAHAETETCEQVMAMARMARAESVAAAVAERKFAGDSYRAKTVYAARVFILHPNDVMAAGRLLSLIPSDKDEEIAWSAFGDAFLCEKQSDSDMRTLAKLGAELPSLLASAATLKPSEMPRYVRYAFIAAGNPDNDHTVQMERVCRTRRDIFVRAVKALVPDEKAEFDARVFDVKKCKAIHLPESDDE